MSLATTSPNGYRSVPAAPLWATGDDEVAIQQQIEALTEKVDDVRGSVAAMAVSQEKTAGDVRVLSAKLDGFDDRIEPRLAALEVGRERDEWKAWAERLLSGAGLAGLFELARHWIVR